MRGCRNTEAHKVWATSQRKAHRLYRALLGNVKDVAKLSCLSNVHLALRSNPDVALLQELGASREEVQAAAKRHGYVVAAAEGEPCLSAVFFRPGCGQQLKLPTQGEFGKRIAAACVSLGGGCGCCLASVYGIANGTVEQKEA